MVSRGDVGLVEPTRGTGGSWGDAKRDVLKRSRVLMLAGYFPLVAGGAEYQTYLLAGELRKHHEVSYLFRYGSQKQSLKMHGYALCLVPKHYWRQRLLGSDYVLDYWAIMAWLKHVAPDVIYNRGANAYTGIAAYYAKRIRCRMVWHIACDRDVEAPRSDSGHGRILEPFDRKCVEYGIRNADAIIGQTTYQDELLQRNYGRRCDLVIGNAHPHPVDPVVKDTPVVVVWVANLKPLKQPEMFIRLVEMLRHRRDVKFVMIGRPASGRYQRWLEEAMEGLSNFSYQGERPIDEVSRTLASAHVFVNTSLYEGFPNTFVQAWYRQVPVVSLNVDPDNVLKREGLGFHSRSFAGLVRDTERLIDDRALRESMGKKAHEYACRHHAMGPNTAEIISLLTNIH